jgi:hypothetical protein
MTEKLDLFSKILLATSIINYMASSLNAVDDQLRCPMISRINESGTNP